MLFEERDGDKVITKGPLWLFDIPKPRVLLVVAHPDDETIFAGGLILSSRETRWTVICCIPESDRRRDEFRCACRFLAKESGNRVDPILLDLEPISSGHIDDFALAKKLSPYATGYDIVFTHNSQGEYGHPRHKLVHRCVIDSITNPNKWVFISLGSKNVNQEELRSKKPEGNFTLDLSPEIQRLKIRVFQECHASQAKLYGYDPISGKLRDTDLRETLLWEFESGKEEYTFHR